MKCLGGMQYKFKQTHSEYLKHLTSASADDEHTSELFHGFQTIKALEKDAIITDLATPNFITYVENMMKNETRTTQDELKLVNEKLEKVLISCGRKSIHRRTTTHGSKLLEEAAKKEMKATPNPRQHCSSGSEVRLPKTSILKDQRTTLLELFDKTKMREEKVEAKHNIGKQNEKKTVKSPVHLMGKILKRKMSHASSKHSTPASIGTIDFAITDEKLHKIPMLQRFNPETSAISQKSQTLRKYATNGNFPDEEGYRNRKHMLPKDFTTGLSREDPEMIAKRTKNKVSHLTCGGGDTNWKRECWIKSDAEYLILEL
ncbi:hypothetical protein CTI12_AA138330 [Artemisia annua]|uniref:Uncharacterized protein n=1 Tax=Artemisia annua TaxID=35608 RepID=A0A2U1PLT2_ARTAN|nr:hypothetical protein CTI12_AA138330 [Artemisia annua]